MCGGNAVNKGLLEARQVFAGSVEIEKGDQRRLDMIDICGFPSFSLLARSLLRLFHSPIIYFLSRLSKSTDDRKNRAIGFTAWLVSTASAAYRDPGFSTFTSFVTT